MTRFAARGEAWATLVVAGAMGVRQDFYAPFAAFLAESGVHALTFDYRGHGFSRDRQPLREEGATISDWAEKDLAAMAREARAMGPGLPLLYVGHSLGGQLLGVLPGNEGVRAALFVTAGSGYYKLNDRIPFQVRLYWFGAVPLLTPLFGYFPGKRLRMVGDLPRGVAWQWRRWCLHPEYLLSEGPRYREAFDRVRAPILALSYEDDDIIPRPAVESLNGFYRNAALEHRHAAPPPGGRVGHFGFFAGRSRERHWVPARDWLAKQARSAGLGGEEEPDAERHVHRGERRA